MTLLRRLWAWLLPTCSHCHRRRLPFQCIRLSGQDYCYGNAACLAAGIAYAVRRHQRGLCECCEMERCLRDDEPLEAFLARMEAVFADIERRQAAEARHGA